jgi:hypothetical protein
MRRDYSSVYRARQGFEVRLSLEPRCNVIQRTPEYPFRKLSPDRANPAVSARDELAMGKTETETINPRHGASLKEYDHAS